MKCPAHPKYQAKRAPGVPCEGCWLHWFESGIERAKALEAKEKKLKFEKELEERRKWIEAWNAANPGWVWGRRGPRQIGVYDG